MSHGKKFKIILLVSAGITVVVAGIATWQLGKLPIILLVAGLIMNFLAAFIGWLGCDKHRIECTLWFTSIAICTIIIVSLNNTLWWVNWTIAIEAVTSIWLILMIPVVCDGHHRQHASNMVGTDETTDD